MVEHYQIHKLTKVHNTTVYVNQPLAPPGSAKNYQEYMIKEEQQKNKLPRYVICQAKVLFSESFFF